VQTIGDNQRTYIIYRTVYDELENCVDFSIGIGAM
jgi:hypothetical protein